MLLHTCMGTHYDYIYNNESRKEVLPILSYHKNKSENFNTSFNVIKCFFKLNNNLTTSFTNITNEMYFNIINCLSNLNKESISILSIIIILFVFSTLSYIYKLGKIIYKKYFINV